MVRARLLAALGLLLIVTGLFVHQPIYAAHGTPPRAAHEASTAEYGDNTEEIACLRWQCNHARHWRYVLTQR